jgi:hypothetical protein
LVHALQSLLEAFPPEDHSGDIAPKAVKRRRGDFMRALKAISLLFVVLVLAAGCRSMTGESAGQNIDDATITSQAKTKLAAERASNLTRVSVATADGMVPDGNRADCR